MNKMLKKDEEEEQEVEKKEGRRKKVVFFCGMFGFWTCVLFWFFCPVGIYSFSARWSRTKIAKLQKDIFILAHSDWLHVLRVESH